MQERQFPESGSEALAPAERRALQRVRARRVQGLNAGVGAALLALFVIGCPEPADLQNADAYKPATAGAPSTAGSGGSSSAACEVACVKETIQAQCKLCHSKSVHFAGLDLDAAGYTDRLKNMPPSYMDLSTGTAADCPTGGKLIDAMTPANSWLLKKIHAEQGKCGTAMPPPPTVLTAAQKTCLETYVACVGGGPAPGGTAGAAAGGTTGGGSAGAASGGTAGAPTGGGGAGGNGGAGGGGGRGGAGGGGGRGGAGGGGGRGGNGGAGGQ